MFVNHGQAQTLPQELLTLQITVLKPESSAKLRHTTEQCAMKNLFLKVSVSIFEAPVCIVKLPLWKRIPLDPGRELRWTGRGAPVEPNSCLLARWCCWVPSLWALPFPFTSKEEKEGGSQRKLISRNGKEKVAKTKHLFLCGSHTTQLGWRGISSGLSSMSSGNLVLNGRTNGQSLEA